MPPQHKNIQQQQSDESFQINGQEYYLDNSIIVYHGCTHKPYIAKIRQIQQRHEICKVINDYESNDEQMSVKFEEIHPLTRDNLTYMMINSQKLAQTTASCQEEDAEAFAGYIWKWYLSKLVEQDTTVIYQPQNVTFIQANQQHQLTHIPNTYLTQPSNVRRQHVFHIQHQEDFELRYVRKIPKGEIADSWIEHTSTEMLITSLEFVYPSQLDGLVWPQATEAWTDYEIKPQRFTNNNHITFLKGSGNSISKHNDHTTTIFIKAIINPNTNKNLNDDEIITEKSKTIKQTLNNDEQQPTSIQNMMITQQIQLQQEKHQLELVNHQLTITINKYWSTLISSL
ncbi:unnamed protein product [Didymodactylos carnosus]|uniref:Uncharacterized protein n=1 Tax=Didymodactylos carnosus TaxID=1234261 RepID=A0A814HR44_9BILA|nr:unnamed protein product [Didymodactylos carnosus]CAF1301257.1 unnamed protein product [Didymodactylos carnosus]CAF3785166.1 unnamed protein product [Didymodactylos carnosus]CAF4107565.1 unnamed protein product [Didymodactylos carnosus]